MHLECLELRPVQSSAAKRVQEVRREMALLPRRTAASHDEGSGGGDSHRATHVAGHSVGPVPRDRVPREAMVAKRWTIEFRAATCAQRRNAQQWSSARFARAWGGDVSRL